MSEINFDSSYSSENVSNLANKSKKLINLKKGDLLIIEKLSRNKNKFRLSKFGLNNEELKFATLNKSNTIDYNETLAFNLANTITRRRFKYFWGKKDDSEEDLEIKKKIEEEKRRKKEMEEKERREKERIERELKEKEKREKQKKKEFMKTIEINVEERKRKNHNYKIVRKLTKEIEVPNNDIKNKIKNNKEEPQKKIFSANHFKANTDLNIKGKYETPVIKNIRPELKTKRIIISKEDNNKNKMNNINQVNMELNEKTIIKEEIEDSSLLNRTNDMHQDKQIIAHESNPGKDSKIENKKIIIVNKVGGMNKNNEINKNVEQKNGIKKDITINQYENYVGGK